MSRTEVGSKNDAFQLPASLIASSNVTDNHPPVAIRTIQLLHTAIEHGYSLEQLMILLGGLGHFPQQSQPIALSLPAPAQPPARMSPDNLALQVDDTSSQRLLRSPTASSRSTSVGMPVINLTDSGNTPSLSCVDCAKNFSRKADLLRHNKMKHERAALFLCPAANCYRRSKPFTRKDKLDEHVRNCHSLNTTITFSDVTPTSDANGKQGSTIGAKRTRNFPKSIIHNSHDASSPAFVFNYPDPSPQTCPGDTIQDLWFTDNTACHSTEKHFAVSAETQTTTFSNKSSTQDLCDNDSVSEAESQRRLKRRSVSQPPAEEATAKLRFACPYFQRNPERYNKSCNRSGWESVHRAREHLYRRHMLTNECPCCWEQFKTADDLQAHSRPEGLCLPRSRDVDDGFTADQQERLKYRMKCKTEEEKWKAVYQILFPDDSEIPSPYHITKSFTKHSPSPSPSDKISEYHDFLAPRISNELKVLIEQNCGNPININHLKNKITDILNSCYQKYTDPKRCAPQSEASTPAGAPFMWNFPPFDYWAENMYPSEIFIPCSHGSAPQFPQLVNSATEVVPRHDNSNLDLNWYGFDDENRW